MVQTIVANTTKDKINVYGWGDSRQVVVDAYAGSEYLT